MGSDARRASDALLTSRLLSSPEYQRAGCLFLYLGVGFEPDTRPVIENALSGGRRVALPIITGPGRMEAREIGSLEELVPGRFAIPAPPADSSLIPPGAFDLILVPGAAFTRGGKRLGRGGGYYDRYLPRSSGTKIALARGIQLFEELPAEPHDIPMDLLITDQ